MAKKICMEPVRRIERLTFPLRGDCTTNCAIPAFMVSHLGIEPSKNRLRVCRTHQRMHVTHSGTRPETRTLKNSRFEQEMSTSCISLAYLRIGPLGWSQTINLQVRNLLCISLHFERIFGTPYRNPTCLRRLRRPCPTQRTR